MVTTTPLSRPLSAPVVNRPNTVAVGTIVWLGSEVMFFAGLFAIYFTLRSTSPELWASQTEKLNVYFSGFNTAVLIASSFTCQFGVFAAERLQHRRKSWKITEWGMVEWFFVTYVMGAMFIIGQIYEYSNLMMHEGVLINSDPYGSAFYLTTGFHGLHVTCGLIAFLLVIGRAYAVKNFGHKEATSAIVVSYYWHFVDVVWIALFFVIYILK
ncbi:heme-copper oxidase subunit III [Galbitalea sp. SE-J8]|uniref:aa3-type cytochrome oxidase subunit III n=1 Tax=Galbitalea sp. SE-J8 TaxID=3054952 RepID=UPI00259CCE45|nr:heme-copper oxidase subunit III [Galbitalea sp. SE-J8]MDM4763985.1 heme-copper oxidase subunit III [Galbitalea sp. SE-J8]